jgi:methylmalonyl-CoA mutase
VNKFRIKTEEKLDILSIDNENVRKSQIAKLNLTKSQRNPENVKLALQKLKEAATSLKANSNMEENLLHLAVNAARARATLGEISLALEEVWGRYTPSTQMVQGAYKASFNSSSDDGYEKEFNEILTKVNEFAQREGRRPRILVAKMGQDGHDRGAKVISSGFSDLGYDVDVGPLFSTPEEVARQAIDADVHVVGVSSQAAGHRTLVPSLIEALKAQGGSHIKVIALSVA